MGTVVRRRCTVIASMLVLGCAGVPPAQTQRIDVLVERDGPDRGARLDCEASNAAGAWRFFAPGPVEVAVSSSPLRIACAAVGGAAPEPSLTASKGAVAAEGGARRGGGIGAAIGVGAAVAVGVAAAPVAGPALALLLAVGGAVKGFELGQLVGAVSAQGPSGYPSPIVLRIGSQTVPAPSAPAGAAGGSGG
jgi:hypothetical protein